MAGGHCKPILEEVVWSSILSRSTKTLPAQCKNNEALDLPAILNSKRRYVAGSSSLYVIHVAKQ